jgi:hypothetical protein
MSGMDRRGFLLGAAGFVLAPRPRTAPSRRVALVTADLESRLVAVELPGGRVLRHVPTLQFPRSIQRVGETAVVAHFDIGALTLVDIATLATTHVLRGFGEPRYTAGHADGRHAYVTDAVRGEIVALDVRTGRVLAREPVGERARHVTIDPAGRTLWVALGSKAEEVAVVDVSDAARPQLRHRFRPPLLAHDVAFARTVATPGSAPATVSGSPSTGRTRAVSSQSRTPTSRRSTSRSRATAST